MSGLKSDMVKQLLLADTDLMYKKAVKISMSLEAAEKDTACLTHSSTPNQERIQQISVKRLPKLHEKEGKEMSSSVNIKRWSCGKNNHPSKICYFRSHMHNF